MLLRSILHVNIDSFLAAVERKIRPELAGKPVIVGRPKGNTSGVVVSASREARESGVEDGMSVRQAQRACPNAHVVSADYGIYRQVSEEFMDILAQYSPLLEPDSLGSAYLDVTASRGLFGDPHRIGSRVIMEVNDRLRLPARVGCASSKLVARAASNQSFGRDLQSLPKPLITHVPPGIEADFLAHLSVSMLDPVTPRVAKRLGELGVSTIGQLAKIPEKLLVRQFGSAGSVMRRQSIGIDPSQVRAAYPSEVINIEQMFEDALEEPAQIEERLALMTDQAAMKLRKRSVLAGEVTLGLQVAGNGSEAENPQSAICNPQSAYFRFKKPTDSPDHIKQTLAKMLETKIRRGMEVTQLGIVFSDLTPGASSQLCLIGEGERRSRVDRATELIRERFGEGAVCIASSLAPVGRSRVLGRIAA